MKQQMVITEDGSSSIYVAELDEYYHSVHGALQESKHIFIEAGLYYKWKEQQSVAILEIGFGTGLNALLTCKSALERNLSIHYTTVEKYPIEAAAYTRLNYCTLDNMEQYAEVLDTIHTAAWEKEVHITDFFTLLKKEMDIRQVGLQATVDLIYFDAFAPSAQPDLWTKPVFESMYRALTPGGILVTYCAKGSVKRTLKEVGFLVESLPGPVGKREITRAVKPANTVD